MPTYRVRSCSTVQNTMTAAGQSANTTATTSPRKNSHYQGKRGIMSATG
jgi:hypothetical protein